MNSGQERVYLAVSSEVYYRLDVSKGRELNAMVTELSNNGLKFISFDNIPKNSILSLRMIFQKDTSPLCTKSRVLWQRQVNSLYQRTEKGNNILLETAVVFTDFAPADKENYDNYLTRLYQKISVNRAHLRLPVVIDAKILFSLDHLDCVIADIGIEGVKVMTDKEFNMGEAIIISYDLPKAYGKMQLKAKIVRKQRFNELIWVLGLEFLHITIEEKEKILSFISSHLGKGS